MSVSLLCDCDGFYRATLCILHSAVLVIVNLSVCLSVTLMDTHGLCPLSTWFGREVHQNNCSCAGEIASVCNAAAISVFCTAYLFQVPGYFDTLVQAFVSCRVDYCNSLFFGISKELMNRLHWLPVWQPILTPYNSYPGVKTS